VDLPADLERALVDAVGAEHVRPGTEEPGACVDWTGRFVGESPAVVRPADTEQVAAVLAACSAAGATVVPQGGNTGLVGGSVPLKGEIVLSLVRLRRLDDVDRSARQVTAGAGVTLGDLQQHARAAGFAYAVDLAARDTATVGGSVATNAGGVHVLRYGDTRRQLVGVEFALSDGRVVRHLSGLEKDNTGYDLAGLFCGSEGTLGVVTAARLRLVPRRAERVAALLAFAETADALAAAQAIRDRTPDLEAAELFFDDGMRLVCEAFSLTSPFADSSAVYLLIECAADDDPTTRLGSLIEETPASDAAVAHDHDRRLALWSYRELHTSAINTVGAPHKLDVTIPLDRMPAFATEIRARIGELGPGVRVWLFGHALDGNLHVNVTGLAPDDERVEELVFPLVVSLGGSISAEHGIGTAKKRWLHLARTQTEIEVFRAIKLALDPAGILNPNVLL
jgi:FAD/FMN-containing dehydrogenase